MIFFHQSLNFTVSVYQVLQINILNPTSRIPSDSECKLSAYITQGEAYGTTFVAEFFHACYLYLKKEEWNKTKKNILLQQIAILLLDSKQRT